MILGIGTDIVEIKHFKSSWKKAPALLKRVFTKNELKKADALSPQKRLSFYAKRFAGKEAVTKACGTGIGKDISWQDVEILNDTQGAPVVKLSLKAQKFLQKKFKVKKVETRISLSDEKKYVVAFALLQK